MAIRADTTHPHLHQSEEQSVPWSKETLDGLEPLLANNARRFVLFPIKYTALWRAYKHAVSTFWIADSIDGSKDAQEYKNACTNGQRNVVAMLLPLLDTSKMHYKLFYAISTTVKCPEARCFLGFQAMIQNIHQEALDTLSSTLSESHNTQEGSPMIAYAIESLDRKAEWVQKRSEDEQALFSEKLLLFLFVQGIFSCTVSSVFKWVADKDILSCLVYTYQKILVDRETHLNFASLLFYHLKRRPPPRFVENLVTEMVEIERAFAEELVRKQDSQIPLYPILRQIECTADGLLASIGYSPIYGAIEGDGEVDKKITGSLKALYFQHEMLTALAPDMQRGQENTNELISFDLPDI